MSPMPREPPVTRATLPSMEKRFVIEGTMPRRREEGKGGSPGRPARAPLQSPRPRVSGRGPRRRAHGGGCEDRPERPLSLLERPQVQALLPRPDEAPELLRLRMRRAEGRLVPEVL